MTKTAKRLTKKSFESTQYRRKIRIANGKWKWTPLTWSAAAVLEVLPSEEFGDLSAMPPQVRRVPPLLPRGSPPPRAALRPSPSR